MALSNALSATLKADAFARAQSDLRVGLDPFRIAAPFTSQGAAFEEDFGSDSRAIVDGEALYIENNTFCFFGMGQCEPGVLGLAQK